jgi:putative acetyltransferase
MIDIRNEEPSDFSAVRVLNASAFGSPAEADLVDVLRIEASPLISLVAESNGKITGHILFSPVSLSGHPELKIMGLAPMAVLASQQNKGIGSHLVHAGLQRCREFSCGAVAVLGHTGYYPRFGFLPATRFGIHCEYDVPEEAFMIIELQKGYFHGKAGTIHYHHAFMRV